MSLVTWDPTREMSMLQGDVNRLFDRFFGTSDVGMQRWAPAIDILDVGDHYLLRADLPGIDEKDVSIEVEDRTLRISGERRDEREDAGEGYYRHERAYGSFERTVGLPDGVDVDAIDASFDKGVLELHVPKPANVQPRRIEIGQRRGEIEGVEKNGDSKDRRSLKDRVASHI